MPEKVLVYGTLKRGGYNHSLLKGSTFVKGGVFNLPLLMRTVGAFPALEAVSESRGVTGEIYEVPPKVLQTLDRLEDHPYWYERRVYSIDNEPVWVYVRSQAWVQQRPDLPVIESGNW